MVVWSATTALRRRNGPCGCGPCRRNSRSFPPLSRRAVRADFAAGIVVVEVRPSSQRIFDPLDETELRSRLVGVRRNSRWSWSAPAAATGSGSGVTGKRCTVWVRWRPNSSYPNSSQAHSISGSGSLPLAGDQPPLFEPAVGFEHKGLAHARPGRSARPGGRGCRSGWSRPFRPAWWWFESTGLRIRTVFGGRARRPRPSRPRSSSRFECRSGRRCRRGRRWSHPTCCWCKPSRVVVGHAVAFR